MVSSDTKFYCIRTMYKEMYQTKNGLHDIMWHNMPWNYIDMKWHQQWKMENLWLSWVECSHKVTGKTCQRMIQDGPGVLGKARVWMSKRPHVKDVKLVITKKKSTRNGICHRLPQVASLRWVYEHWPVRRDVHEGFPSKSTKHIPSVDLYSDQ